MENKAVKLYFDKGTTLRILFSDGITKKYDVLELAKKYTQLNDLKNRKLFLSGKLFGWGGVIWNDDLDLDAEVVYEDGIEIKSEEKASEIILGFQIKQERLKKHITQSELSELVNIDQADLSRIENGNLTPTLSTINKIARGLDIKFNVVIL